MYKGLETIAKKAVKPSYYGTFRRRIYRYVYVPTNHTNPDQIFAKKKLRSIGRHLIALFKQWSSME